jgi:hypothetical protein
MRDTLRFLRRLGSPIVLAMLVVSGGLPVRGAERRSIGPLDLDAATVPLVNHGLRESATLAGLLSAIDADRATRLRVVFRFQPSSFVRAHSHLRIERGIVVHVEGRAIRIDAVDGEIVLPPSARDDVKLAVLGHELAHVIVRLGSCRPSIGPPDEEILAVAVERAVAAELDRRRLLGSARHSDTPPPALPACLDPSTAEQRLTEHFGIGGFEVRASGR